MPDAPACKNCGSTALVESWHHIADGTNRRRRDCATCGAFQTWLPSQQRQGPPLASDPLNHGQLAESELEKILERAHKATPPPWWGGDLAALLRARENDRFVRHARQDVPR